MLFVLQATGYPDTSKELIRTVEGRNENTPGMLAVTQTTRQFFPRASLIRSDHNSFTLNFSLSKTNVLFRRTLAGGNTPCFEFSLLCYTHLKRRGAVSYGTFYGWLVSNAIINISFIYSFVFAALTSCAPSRVYARVRLVAHVYEETRYKAVYLYACVGTVQFSSLSTDGDPPQTMYLRLSRHV